MIILLLFWQDNKNNLFIIKTWFNWDLFLFRDFSPPYTGERERERERGGGEHDYQKDYNQDMKYIFLANSPLFLDLCNITCQWSNNNKWLIMYTLIKRIYIYIYTYIVFSPLEIKSCLRRWSTSTLFLRACQNSSLHYNLANHPMRTEIKEYKENIKVKNRDKISKFKNYITAIIILRYLYNIWIL